jgi:hypothetical protein
MLDRMKTFSRCVADLCSEIFVGEMVENL